jgi:D-glycero-D-manno-heptose 1,7-bisphosphate phosphatase
LLSSSRPALFLDRDGIINEDVGYPHKKSDFKLITAIIPTLIWAQEEGYYLFIVSNQSGIARNIFPLTDLFLFMALCAKKLRENSISIDHWYYCPYHKGGEVEEYRRQSELRKPRPGMILKALEDYSIDIDKSIMIGDSDTDVLMDIELKTILVSKRTVVCTRKNMLVIDSHKQIKDACMSILNLQF